RIGPIELSSPVVLAPMAGITNTAFRRLCREYGAGLYVTEMVTTRALVERSPKTMRIVHHEPYETPRSVQLYGVDPITMGQAVRMLVEEDRADHIDLNFGCPVPKVTRKGGGSALPWKQDLFDAIVTTAVTEASRGGIPVTGHGHRGQDGGLPRRDPGDREDAPAHRRRPRRRPRRRRAGPQRRRRGRRAARSRGRRPLPRRGRLGRDRPAQGPPRRHCAR